MCWIYWLPIFKGVLVIEDTILLDINNIGLKHKDKLITYSNIFGLLLFCCSEEATSAICGHFPQTWQWLWLDLHEVPVTPTLAAQPIATSLITTAAEGKTWKWTTSYYGGKILLYSFETK